MPWLVDYLEENAVLGEVARANHPFCIPIWLTAYTEDDPTRGRMTGNLLALHNFGLYFCILSGLNILL